MPTIEQLERLLESNPEDVFLNYALAMEFVKVGRTDDALLRFERTLDLDRAYVAAYFHKGRLLINLGRIEDARATLSEGVDVAANVSNEKARRELSELLAELG